MTVYVRVLGGVHRSVDTAGVFPTVWSEQGLFLVTLFSSCKILRLELTSMAGTQKTKFPSSHALRVTSPSPSAPPNARGPAKLPVQDVPG